MSISNEKKKFEFNFRGQEVIFEIDQLAVKSDKSVLCRYGNTTVLTVLIVKEFAKKWTAPFFSLTISLEEKFYAVGRIPAAFNKREGKPSDNAITIARLIDRSLRSFFPLEANHEVQIVNYILSVDPKHDPGMVAAWNSSLVCFLSPLLPYFTIPSATVFISSEWEKNFVLGPSLENSLELIVSATEEKITMLEVEAHEVSEEKLAKSIEIAQQEIRYLIGFFQYIANGLGGKKKNLEFEKETLKNGWLEEKSDEYLAETLPDSNTSWWEKEKKIKAFRQELIKEYSQKDPHLEKELVENLVEKVGDDRLIEWMKKTWKTQQRRIDGRKSDEIRPLEIQTDYLPTVHGSALFGRGDTKVLSVITIGKASEKKINDSVFSRSYKHFIHHYNFPNFAVSEIANYRGVSRREIGHGQLVEKTFNYLIPSNDLFPYTVRAVSEVLSSDGSSSQASICATSLALMTAGVPLIRPVAGIAIGLFEGEIYTDINGLEDKLGEMDFKIAGTEKGICSLQLDVKNQGISTALLKECLKKARRAHHYLLEKMKEHILHPRPNLPTQVIKCRKFYVEKEKIGWIIGPSGKTINQLIEKTGASIEVQPDGYVLAYHQEEKQLEKLFKLIQEIINK
jgi:polyribonucleotide nucleotidyltransferase